MLVAEYKFVRADERGVWHDLSYLHCDGDAAATAQAVRMLDHAAYVLIRQGQRRVGLVANLGGRATFLPAHFAKTQVEV